MLLKIKKKEDVLTQSIVCLSKVSVLRVKRKLKNRILQSLMMVIMCYELGCLTAKFLLPCFFKRREESVAICRGCCVMKQLAAQA